MKLDIVRAWKDETYRQSLNEDMINQLPANPAGEMDLSDACLDTVYGGRDDEHHHLLAVLEDIHVFSVNILANPITQTCARIEG
jgi:mersacidin/lichenicidin family type 2 lantibiotic